MKNLFLLTFMVFALFSCKSNYYIEENQFVNIYADLLIAKEMHRGNDSAYIRARDSIYNHYNVNQFMVDKTLEYYNSDTKKWKELYEKVIRRLEEQQTQIQMSN